MSSETPQTYTDRDLNFISQYQEAIKDMVAKYFPLASLDYSTIIAGQIAEEFHDRHESYVDQVTQYGADLRASSRSHQELLDSYNTLTNDPSILDGIGPVGKFNNPASIDVGPGNIQIFTAINLIKDYSAANPDSDPLNLKQYENNYDKLVADLINPTKTTTAAVYTLVMERGERW